MTELSQWKNMNNLKSEHLQFINLKITDLLLCGVSANEFEGRDPHFIFSNYILIF